MRTAPLPLGSKLKKALFCAFCVVISAACDKVAEPEASPEKPTSAEPSGSAGSPTDPQQLIKDDLKPGTGERAVKKGDEIKVNYVGKLLKNGSKFDENTSADEPFTFTVGEGVIEGWSEGVIGMKKGGKRKLTIPWKMAYGDKGSPPKIPGKAPLVFEIDLLGWADEPAAAGSASAAPAAGSASAAPAAGSAAPAAGSAAPASGSAKAGPSAKPPKPSMAE